MEKKDIEQEIMEMFDKNFWIDMEYRKGTLVEAEIIDQKYKEIKSFISHIITLVQKREREEMVERIGNTVFQDKTGEKCEGWLAIRTDFPEKSCYKIALPEDIIYLLKTK